MSIRLRLTLWYTLILAVMLMAFGIVLYFFLSATLYNKLKDELDIQANRVYREMDIRTVFPTNNVVIVLPNLTAISTSNLYLQAVNIRDKSVVKSSNLGMVNLPFTEQTLQAVNEQNTFTVEYTIDNVPLLVHNKGVRLGNSSEVGILLQVAARTDYIHDSLHMLKMMLLSLGLVIVLIASSMGWFMARKALRPIEHVIAAAGQIEKSDDLSHRIIYEGPQDEIGRLTSTINGMLSRIQNMYSELDEAYRVQRRFVSDASHELRTPLTTIRGNVELLEKMWKDARASADGSAHSHAPGLAPEERRELSLEAMRDIAGEAERMSRLVNDLLSLARADTGTRRIATERVELKPLVEEVARKAHHLPRRAAWAAGDLSALEGRFVLGSPDYLQQLLFIFIENAFKYTPQGEVSLDALWKDGQLGIRIKDTGIGMDKDEVPHIFERFYRADPSRGETSGTGLGLSIAQWIIDEHGGSVEVATRKGVGTIFVIWLPEWREAALPGPGD